MTHYNAETLEEVTDKDLARGYDSYLDDHGLYDGLNIDGVELIPSEVLKSTDPVGYQDCLNTYINALYDAGELVSEWDRADRIKELCNDWAFDVLGEALDLTTTEEDQTIYSALYRLCEQGVLELDCGEIQLSSQHTMSEVLITIGAALTENKTNE